MKVIAGLLLVFFTFMQVPAGAEEQASKEKWLKDLRAMVGKIVPKKAPAGSATAVSGVRGADENAKDTLYWRGKKENLSEAEISAFNSALTDAGEGKTEEAIRKFEEFRRNYPSSALAKDAMLTAKKLKG